MKHFTGCNSKKPVLACTHQYLWCFLDLGVWEKASVFVAGRPESRAFYGRTHIYAHEACGGEYFPHGVTVCAFSSKEFWRQTSSEL